MKIAACKGKPGAFATETPLKLATVGEYAKPSEVVG